MGLCTGLVLTLAGLASHASTLAQFRTVLGDIDVELYDAEKPVTTGNFKRLVLGGAYRYSFFHRVVPGFAAQGGGYLTFIPGNTNLFAPPWSNLGFVPDFGTITNEFNVGPMLSNTNGTLAMAKLEGNPNSASSEWFFNLANNSTNLDNQNGGFTVFGRVLRDPGGVLNYFNQTAYGVGIVNMGWWYTNDFAATNLFRTLPVIYFGAVQPRYADLFYVDIVLLSVQIAATNNQRLISWRSVAGKTNVVEYSAVVPPVWQMLGSTNGNGGTLTIADTNALDRARLYRIRINY